MRNIRTKLAAGGRLVIPAEFRQALGIKVGDAVVLHLSDHEVRIVTPREAIRHAQELVRRHVGKGKLLSQELIEDRRAEAKRE